MPSVLDTMSETIEAWLTQEEQALARLSRRSSDPAVAERLRIWQQRIRAYEQFEVAVAQGRALQSRTELVPRAVPDPIERGLRLIS